MGILPLLTQGAKKNAHNIRQKTICLLALAAIWTATPAGGQIVPRLNFFSSYTDNLFQTSERQSDWVNQFYLDFDYVARDDVNLYYSGNANVFNEFVDLFSHTHRVGLSYLKTGEDNGVLYAGSEIAVRLDRSLYDYRDFVQAQAFVNLKRYLRPTLMTRAGYTLRYQEYTHARDFSFVEQVGFAQVSAFLPRRTTLQMRTELGLKSYLRERQTDEFFESGRQGAVLQWVVKLKAAQSLADVAGLRASYTMRRNISGESRPVEEAFYDADDELFDDRYSYQSDEVQAVLKYLAPLNAEVEVGGSWARRRYGGRPALDLEGNFIGADVERQDTRRSASLGLVKTFYMEGGWAREVDVEFEWLYRNTQSNDPYYDAAGQMFSTGVQIGF